MGLSEDEHMDQILAEFLVDRQWLTCNKCGIIGDSKDPYENKEFTAYVDTDSDVIEFVCDICEPI